ncbi:hypothetical protein ACFQL0_22650 [Haloplanus litoreus]|uniref:Uncharacterized protein n=1 Tax=Haloplanus litoreus TaxID=767515 RepID=A0ABD6A3Q3_9EURY
MPLRSLNDYDALDSADATDADLHVENGLITDGNGNTVEIGDIQTGAVSWGNRDEGVDRVKDATPTGNLEVRNQAPYVDGYGEVELTNSAHRRTITQIGNTDGNDGDLRTDANGSLTIRFEGTVSKSDSNTATTTYSTTGTNVLYATFPSVSGTVTGFGASGGTNFNVGENHSGTIEAGTPWGTSDTDSFDASVSALVQPAGTDATGYEGDQVSLTVDIDTAESGEDFEAEVTATTRYDTTETQTRTVTLF